MKTLKNILFLILNLALLGGNSYVAYKLATFALNLKGYKDEHIIMEGVCKDLDSGKEVKVLAEQVTILEKLERGFTGIIRSRGEQISCLDENINIVEKIGIRNYLPPFLRKEKETVLLPVAVKAYDTSFILSLKNKELFIDGECTNEEKAVSQVLERHPLLIQSVEPVRDVGFITGKSYLTGEKFNCDIEKVSYSIADAEGIHKAIFKHKPLQEKIGENMMLTGECQVGEDFVTPSEAKATLLSYNEEDKSYHFIISKRNIAISAICAEGKFAVHPLTKKQEDPNGR